MKKIFTLFALFIAVLFAANGHAQIGKPGNDQNGPIGLAAPLAGCTTGTLSGNVTLTCTGNAEGMGLSFTGSYYNVYLIAGNSYLFDDGYAGTRYVTISNLTGTTVLASGNNTVTYSPATTGSVRFYVHADANCSMEQLSGYPSVTCIPPTCSAPSNFIVTAVSSNSATIKWTANNNVTTRYELFHGLTNQPAEWADPLTSDDAITVINELSPNMTYHFWVRAVCGALDSPYVYGGSFRTLSSFTCNSASYGIYPPDNYTPTCNATAEVIADDSYAGEFCKVNVQSGGQYRFSSSNPTDFITITNEAGTSAYGSGTTPINWTSSITGAVRYYIHKHSSCGDEALPRIRYVTCSGTTPLGCTPPTNVYVDGITPSQATVYWTAASPNPGSYEIYYNTTGVVPTASTGIWGATSNSSMTIINLTNNTTYYVWVRSGCSATSKSVWVSAGSFVAGSTGVSCGAPTNLSTTATTNTGTRLLWNAPNAGSPSSYDIYFNTSSTSPTSSTTPSGSTASVGAVNITQLSPGTTYYFWIRSDCGSTVSTWTPGGSFTTTGGSTSSCGAPTNVSTSGTTATTATLLWNAPATVPVSYDVYFSTSSTTPSASTTPSGNTTQAGNVNLISLTASTTYYFWVRSNCGTTQSAWISGGSFTTTAAAAFCNEAPYGLYPETNYTPSCSGSTELINDDAWPGEYANINITANRQYTFSTSVAADYITVTNAAGTVLYANGVSPVIWLSGSTTGVIRYYIHTNAACGTVQVLRNRNIKCTTVTAPTCAGPNGGFNVANITSNSALFSWGAPSVAPTGYQVYHSNTNTAPSAGLPTTEQVTPTNYSYMNDLIGGRTYYYWVRSVCGTTAGTWTFGGTFNTPAAASCNGALYGLWPTATYSPTCTGAVETINTDAYAGEFTNVNVVSNKVYTFSSSVATDYITIANPSGVVLAGGATPFVWNSGTDNGVVRYHIHNSAACGSQESMRTRRIQCGTTLEIAEATLEGLQLYPNPVKDQLTITYSQQISTVEISNTLGQIIQQRNINAANANIDLSGYAAGMYMIKVTTDHGSKTVKIIKK